MKFSAAARVDTNRNATTFSGLLVVTCNRNKLDANVRALSGNNTYCGNTSLNQRGIAAARSYVLGAKNGATLLSDSTSGKVMCNGEAINLKSGNRARVTNPIGIILCVGYKIFRVGQLGSIANLYSRPSTLPGDSGQPICTSSATFLSTIQRGVRSGAAQRIVS